MLLNYLEKKIRWKLSNHKPTEQVKKAQSHRRGVQEDSPPRAHGIVLHPTKYKEENQTVLKLE